MEVGKDHQRHLMLAEFNSGKNATKAAEAICAIYGVNTVRVRAVQYWFERFRLEDFSLADEPRGGRPKVASCDDLEALLVENPTQSSRDLAEQLEVSHQTILRRFHEMGKIQKAGKWIPHELSTQNKLNRLTTCTSLVNRHKKAVFFTE